MSLDDTLLFNEYSLYSVLNHNAERMLREIDSADARRVMTTDPDTLASEFDNQFRVAPLELRGDQISKQKEEVQIDVRDDPRRFVYDRSVPALVPGTRLRFYLPFTGDPTLLR